MFQPIGNQDLMRVLQERERDSKRLIERLQRTAALRDFFIERDLFFFQLVYLLFICRDQDRVVSFGNPVEELLCLAFDLKQIAADGVCLLLGVVASGVPQIGEYLGSQEEISFEGFISLNSASNSSSSVSLRTDLPY